MRANGGITDALASRGVTDELASAGVLVADDSNAVVGADELFMGTDALLGGAGATFDDGLQEE